MARIYVGNLPLDIREKDLEDLFWKYGRIRDLNLKNPARPPAFAFVSFERYEDAEDAIRGRDGVMFEGQRLRVEMSKGSAEALGVSSGGYGGAPARAPARDLRRSEFRVIVSGLPPSASWQDLKDFFRPAGDVIYADVDRQGGGIVEFASKSDQEYALSKMDDKEFKNPYDKCYIRVKRPKDQAGSRSRSRGRRSSRTRSRSKGRSDRDRSRSKGRSDRDRSRSKGRSERRSSRRSRSRSRSRSGSRGGRRRGPDSDDDTREKDKDTDKAPREGGSPKAGEEAPPDREDRGDREDSAKPAEEPRAEDAGRAEEAKEEDE